jgi:hypothetical protein
MAYVHPSDDRTYKFELYDSDNLKGYSQTDKGVPYTIDSSFEN